MDRLKTILVGIDFSRHSRNALAQAMRLARWNAAQVHVIHVIKPLVLTDLAAAYGVSELSLHDDVQETARKHADQVAQAAMQLDTLTAERRQTGVHASVAVMIGNPLVSLLQKARELAADLIVVGARGQTGDRDSLGTTTAKLIRRATCKVLIARGFEVEPFRCVAACVDFSPVSKRIIEQGLRVARHERCRLDVVHAYRPPWELEDYRPSLLQLSDELKQKFVADLQTNLDRLITPDEADRLRVKFTTHLASSGDPAIGVIDHLRAIQADLAVVGRQGQSSEPDTLLGTTAEKIIRGADCSVLIVK